MSLVLLRTYFWDDEEPMSGIGKTAAYPVAPGGGGSLDVQNTNIYCVLRLDFVVMQGSVLDSC